MNHDEVPNPFPGLRPFEFGDNHLFFGRDQQTTELTTRLRKNRFVAVVGTSGSGKSSLVRAGLMPELLSGTMAGAGSSWETTIMRPGGDPLTNLANAIVDADLYDPEEEDIASQVRATLTRSGLGLVEAMRQSELPEGTNFLLVVDQFEEIFRFRRSDDATDEQAAFFVNLLLEASAQADLPLYVIITMRSDFLGECSQFPRLADTVNEGEFLIPRLNRDQRKEAIVAPVKVAGGEIADRLLLRLLNDIGDDPDQLPILQHALMRTWDLFKERGGDGALDLEHYQATGGMGEALSRHADEVYNALQDDEHKRIAEKLFKSLTEKVDANRGIRRPMQLAELHEICGGEESHLREVLDAFRKTGCTFLMPAGEAEIKTKTVIDISHESLMRAWRSLRNWVDEEAQSAKIYRRSGRHRHAVSRRQSRPVPRSLICRSHYRGERKTVRTKPGPTATTPASTAPWPSSTNPKKKPNVRNANARRLANAKSPKPRPWHWPSRRKQMQWSAWPLPKSAGPYLPQFFQPSRLQQPSLL